MSAKRNHLGSHCPRLLDGNGLPLLRLPDNWQGLAIEETFIPGHAECGPQYTDIPLVFIGLNAQVKRWYRSGGKTIELTAPPPSFDILGADYERDYGRWEGENGNCIKVSLEPSLIRRYFPDEAHLFNLETRFENRDDQFRHTILQLVDEIRAGLPNGTMYAEGLSLAALGWLNSHYKVKGTDSKSPGKLTLRHQQRIDDYIDASLSTDITIEKLASLVNISPSHFFLLFRLVYGIPPYQYVMRKRVEKAAELLKTEPERSISDISIATGFSSQAHLTKAFKRYKNQTPYRWKMQYRTTL